MRVVSIGEVLWDVFPDSEKLGGAPFNFSYHAHRLGHEVLFLSAVGRDARGDAIIEQASSIGLPTGFIQRVEEAPTGTVSVELDAAGVPAFTIHRPAAYDLLRLEMSDLERIAAWGPDWIYFGTLHQMDPQIRGLTERLIESNPAARHFCDINLRQDSYTVELLAELLPKATVAKLNDDEAAALSRLFGQPHRTLEEFCRAWSGRYGWDAVCVTRGERGCAVLIQGEYAEVKGYRVTVVDTVGSGDAFAAAFLHGLDNHWPPARIGDFANRVGALVASRAGGVPPWTLEECERMQ